MIEQKMITFYEFAQKVFIGRRIFNKKTGKEYMQWEAYFKIRHFWESVVQGIHTEFGMRDKTDWTNGRYHGSQIRNYDYKFKRKGEDN